MKRGSGLPMHSFIDVSVLEQRLQIFENFQKFLCILLLTICQDLSKTFLFIYFFCNFNFFVSVFKYIVTRRYTVTNMLTSEFFYSWYFLEFLYLILFRGPLTDGGGGGCCKKTPLHKICHTYPTMMKLCTVIPWLKKIKKIYESRDTPPEFYWHQHFSV